MKREERKILAQKTLEIIRTGVYEINGQLVDVKDGIDKSIEGTKTYGVDELNALSETEFTNQFETLYEVNENDVVKSIIDLRRSNLDENIMCLNFASAKNPGGGFLNGAIAQEEALAFASSLYGTQIKDSTYYDLHKRMKSCVYTDTMIYSPDVHFFRDSNGELLLDPVNCNVITSAAVNTGVVKQREKGIVKNIPDLMKIRTRKLLSLAASKEDRVLILGAWGCGVFQNEPKLISGIFKELLANDFKGVFKKVVFSVYSRNPRFIEPFKNDFE